MKILVSLAFLASAVSLAQAQTLSVSPKVAGTSTYSYLVPSNGGGGIWSSPTGGSTLIAGGSFNGYTAWAAEFSLTGLPAGSTITSAILSARVSSNPNKHTVFGFAGDGYLSGDDFINGAYLAFGMDYAAGNALDVTGFVRTRVAAGDRFAGFKLVHFGTPTTWYGTDTTNGPRLTIQYAVAPVPEPAAFLPLGLGALVLRRRRG